MGITFPKRFLTKWNIERGRVYRLFHNYKDDSITLTPESTESKYALIQKHHKLSEERKRLRRELWESGNGTEERLTLLESSGEYDKANSIEILRRIRMSMINHVFKTAPLFSVLDHIEMMHNKIQLYKNNKRYVILE